MKSSPQPTPTARRPDYRRIAEGLRREIVSGKYAAGAQLPSTRELAAIWKSSVFTIHTAVHALVKEGWVERLGGAGTYVADFKNRFSCAGIYHGSDIFSHEESSFSRALHTALLDQLHKLRKDTLVFIDTRPYKKQANLLPALAEAIAHRRIQCLIAPSISSISTPALTRVSLPTAFAPTGISSHYVELDFNEMLRNSLRTLAKQGCRTVGFISSVVRTSDPKDPWFDYYPRFEKMVKEEGLVTHERWIRAPEEFHHDQERYGYHEFKKLWAQRDKPTGLIVYPDFAVRGAAMAIVSLGVRVPQQMRFVFHRNSHGIFLCPFPATWAITDEAKVAAEYIKMIQRQFKGEKVLPVFVPHVFKSEKGEE